MPSPKRGEIWLVRFPFTDLTTTKRRPALVVAPHGQDIIVVGIFSRIPPLLRSTWVLIDEQDSGFQQSGLKKSSIIKTEKLAVIHESVFDRRLGILPSQLAASTAEALKQALLIS